MSAGRLGFAAISLFGLLALAPLALPPWQIGQLAQLLTYGLAAASLALIWGQAGILSFGHAVFFGTGAYAMALVTLGMVPGLESWDDSATGLLAAILVPALLANLLGRFLFHGRGLRGAHVAIVMLAVSVVVERLAINWDYAGGLNGLMNVPPLRLAWQGREIELFEPLPAFYVTLGIAALVYLLLQALVEGRFGLILRAIRGDEDRTAFFGFDVTARKVWAFTLSGAVAGLAGALFAARFGFVSPPLLGFALSTEILIWTALGGRGILLAAFAGGLVVPQIELRLGDALGAYWLLGLGALFVLTVIVLPRGLIGEPLARLVTPRRRIASEAASPRAR